jgi:methylphosphotriester-DNA--protein-cysteine methyltransferase
VKRSLEQVAPALTLASRGGQGDVTLAALASAAGLSPFQLHRAFSAVTDETPKQYTSRLRLERAAARFRQPRGFHQGLSASIRNYAIRVPEAGNWAQITTVGQMTKTREKKKKKTQP